MKLETFIMERTQSVWENRVEVNLAESGVEPLTLGELVDGLNVSDTRLSYPQTNGTEELRDRIADLYPGADPDNVVAVNGTAEANYIAVTHLVEPEDEVVVMMPNYMQIWGLARSLGAQVKKLPLREETDWGPDLEELRRIVNDKTKLIAVCNPNNPTGAVLSENTMREIAKIAGGVGAYILSDEVYQGAELDGELSPTFYGWYDRLVVTSGLSKAYGLPGLRMGWMVADTEKSAELWSYKDYTTIAPGALSDRLATVALEPSTRKRILDRTRGILNRQLPLVTALIERHADRLSLVPPKAGAIVFLRYDWKINSTVLMERVRDERSLLIVPGDHFDLDGYVRLGYGYDGAKLSDGLDRLSDFLSKLEP